MHPVSFDNGDASEKCHWATLSLQNAMEFVTQTGITAISPGDLLFGNHPEYVSFA